MKFHIVGAETPKVTFKTNKSNSCTDSLSSAIYFFNRCNLERRFHHSYLLIDFENKKPKILETLSFKESDIGNMPYLIIGEYHYDQDTDPEMTFRSDKLIVRTKGFDHEYKDNIAAIKDIVAKSRSDIYAELFIEYKVYVEGLLGIKERYICSTDEINNPIQYIKKFEVEPFNVEPGDIEPRVFYTYTLDKDPSSKLNITKFTNTNYAVAADA